MIHDEIPNYMDLKKLLRATGKSSQRSFESIRETIDGIAEIPTDKRAKIEKEIEFALRIIEGAIDD